jgi:hypothetical protein
LPGTRLPGSPVRPTSGDDRAHEGSGAVRHRSLTSRWRRGGRPRAFGRALLRARRNAQDVGGRSARRRHGCRHAAMPIQPA